MRRTGLKERIRSRQVTLGSWLALGNAAAAEIMCRAGYDWLTIDMEHSAVTLREAEELIRVIELAGSAPLVRLPDNDPVLVKRVMDAGAHGVIVPMVNSAEEAERAVRAMRYPAEGSRGVGLSRAQGYGTEFEEYRRWLAEESILVVQIEHIQAVRNLEAILAVPGVDAFIVGPYDLSGSLGIPGDFQNPRMLEAMDAIRAGAAKARPAPGYHVVPPDPELVRQRLDEGYTFLAYSTDFILLGDNARKGLTTLRGMAPSGKPSGAAS